MHQFDHPQTADLPPYDALVRQIHQTLRAHAMQGYQVAPRSAIPLPGATLLIMPARGPEYAILKTVTVHPDNPSRGMPSLQGEVLALRASTGEHLATLDGPALTERCTAAVSLLAAPRLAPRTRGSLLIVGAGAQARAHLEAFRAGLDVTEVYVSTRTPARGEALARHAQALGLPARVVLHPQDVLHEVAFVVTATTSRTPVLPTWRPKGVFIAAVGAFTPEMCEVPGEVVRACRVSVDTLEGARVEAGDLLQADIDWRDVTALEGVLDGDVRADAPVLFKSVGHALWDLAAVELALRNWGGGLALT